jgi:predicted DsbA family dithiol-disulfide isomerase
MTIRVAHDFTCPWCWVGLFQAKDLAREFGATIDWVGYELWPLDLDWPAPSPAAPEPDKPSNKPQTPSRMDLAYAAQGMEPPTATRPRRMRTNNVHQAVEFAKTVGVQDEFIERLYRALWEQGREINAPDVLRELASGLMDADAMLVAVEEVRYRDQVVGFDDPAYASGVYNVPTFFIGEERYAGQPLTVLRKAVRGALAEA